MGTFGKYNPLGGNGGISSIIANSPLSVSTMAGVSTLSISQAGAASSGYLSSTDWNTFNNKQPAGTYVTSVGATSPVASSGGTSPTISMPVATSSVDGYLSSTDWNTFNNKQSVVSNYILSPQLYDAGTKTGNFTLDFANGPCQQVTINAAGPLVITLSNPVTGGAYLLKVVQGATPGTVTWPVAVKWGAAGTPTLSNVTGKIDIINLYYDGTNYYGTYALGF